MGKNSGGKKPVNKKRVAIIAVAVAAAVAVAGVASYFAFLKDDDEKSGSIEGGDSQEEIEEDVPSSSADISGNTESKYSNAEIYTNKNGNPAAKTESGAEVELTGDNLTRLMQEYEKVKGTDSPRERELLDQIQLFLEANQGNQ